MFHLGMWRERLRDGLTELSEGREPAGPPANAEELNDRELPSGIGTPLADAAARSDFLVGEIIDLYTKLGDREMRWYRARTTSEAVLGTSYTHPRSHMYAYMRENGDPEGAAKLYEDAVAELRAASATEIPMGAALFNLACARAAQGRAEEAIGLLAETVRLRPDLKANIESGADFAPLRDDPRFQELVKS